jgi:hypothetical protein
VCSVGTIIYILADELTGVLVLYRFDTVAKAFIANGAAGPAHDNGNSFFTIKPFTDGKMLVTYVSAGNIRASVYDPVGNSWAASVLVNAGGSPLGSCIQGSAALGFCVYISSIGGFDVQISCRSISEALAIGAQQNVVDLSAPNGGNAAIANMSVGNPAIVADGTAQPFLLIPYCDPAFVGPPSPGYINLRVARATPAVNPVFANELVTTLAGSNLFQSWDLTTADGVFDSAIIDQGGTAYLFYVTDNGNLNNAASQAILSYKSSSAAGVWSAPTALYTTPLSNELASPFLTLDSNGNIAALINQFDPVIWGGGGDQILALTTLFFNQGLAGAGTKLNIIDPTKLPVLSFPRAIKCCLLCEQKTTPQRPYPMMRGKLLYAYPSWKH